MFARSDAVTVGSMAPELMTIQFGTLTSSASVSLD